ncbi:MAG: Gfo/Idh/MocA family oxidoreductase [Sedimentisphaerales bacterium]
MKKTGRQKDGKISRRDFIGSAAAAAMAFTVVPRNVLGGPADKPPSEKLNVAAVGIGGMGKGNILEIAGFERTKEGEIIPKDKAGENVVALCDVDDEFTADLGKIFPKAKTYRDYRKMLEQQKDIDAVVIATPDHTHAVIALAAMQLGKHVFVQKPLTYSVYEARTLTEAARKYKVATQMGNQGHSGEGARLVYEWIADNAIGKVTEVHAWTDRPTWPQGIDRPKDTPPVPSTLDWDLWLGPAPVRPYHPLYHPRFWRGWRDFGCGALGDMGCHVLDPSFWALKLENPIAVEACVSHFAAKVEGQAWGQVNEVMDSYPAASIVRYEFPASDKRGPVKLSWYDGGLRPAKPDAFEPGRPVGEGRSSVLIIGDNGIIRYGQYGDSPRIIPEAKMQAYKLPPKTIPRIEGSHEQDWVRACKGGPPACSNFDYAGPFTEMVLLGTLALRFPGQRLEWDGQNMKVTNLPEANVYVNRQYRTGWTL